MHTVNNNRTTAIRAIAARRETIPHPQHFLRLLCLTFLILLLASKSFGKTWKVGPHEQIHTIAEAIQLCDNGDTILVRKGIYHEKEMLLQKSITLIGEGMPVIDGEHQYEMLLIKADNVHVEGFRFQYSGYTSIRDIAALKVMNARNCELVGNEFFGNYFCIYLSKVHHCLVERNSIVGINSAETNSGNGIHLWQSDSCRIINNTVRGQRDGIYFEFVKNSYIAHNYSTGNLRYGLHFMFSDGNTYENNTFRKNGAGVAVMYTKHIVMRNNHFDDNWGPSAYGLLLKEINYSTIENNAFQSNTVGIFMESSTSLVMRNNLFRSNGWAIKIFADCIGDTLSANNFISNSFDISTNGSLSQNLFSGNYWDKYQGYDLDKNHIGDVPYRPVSLFSMIIEKIPNSVMLMRSMVADILDQVEKVQPDVIPASLVDNEPLMKPLKLDIPEDVRSAKALKDKREQPGKEHNKNKGWGELSFITSKELHLQEDTK